jgi:ribosomal protein S18 acetylase RimI-like enzyme
LETLAADHWRAATSRRLGQWLLRADGGFTGRANSVLALGDPGMPLEEALAAVREWYAGQRLEPMACLVTGRPGDPDADALAATRGALDRAGWLDRRGAGAVVLTAASGALRGTARPPDGLRLVLMDSPDDAWLRVYNYRGRPLPDRARRLLRSAPDQVFAAVVDDGRTVAVARGSLAHAWAGITAVEVAPTHRRRGLARLMCSALAEWAWDRAARSVFVQVGVDNEAALALYLGCGFERHHRYDYLTPGPGAGASGSGPQTT